MDQLLDLLADWLQVDGEVSEDFRGDTPALQEDAQEDVLRADEFALAALGLFPREGHDPAGARAELLEHEGIPAYGGAQSVTVTVTTFETSRAGGRRTPSAEGWTSFR